MGRAVAIAVRGGLGGVVLGALVAAASARPALADNVTIGAGQEVTLSADVMLAGGDLFTAGDASGPRCKIHGGGQYMIASATDWTGSLTITNCDVDGLGVAGVPDCDFKMGTCTAFSGRAIDLTGGQQITITGSTFSASGQISLALGAATGVAFQHDTITADSVITNVDDSLDMSQDVFYVHGSSTGTMVFQGNVILKGRLHFQVASNWLIGGDAPSDANVLTGYRTGIYLESCESMTVRGNFSHTQRASEIWNQVKNFSIANSAGITVEHNVFRGENWLIEFNGQGEVRYNLLLDAVERGWVLVRDTVGASVHHNVLVATRDNHESPVGAFVVEHDQNATTAPDLQVFNNTFDGAGKCTQPFTGDVVLHGAFMASLRSNAFVGLRIAPPNVAFVQGGETMISSPLPSGLGYSDYNLYDNPDSPVQVIYSTGVAGKTARQVAGFGLNDATAGGAINQQVDPQFAYAMPPRTFPFTEADLISGATTVCQVLAYYRQVYAPAGPASPLAGKGDPADGAGNNIGAIGNGEAADLFGRLCDPSASDIGNPNTAADVFTCPVMNPSGTGGSTGGGPGITTNHNFVCVCEAGAGGGPGFDPFSLFVAAAAAAIVLGRGRGRRRDGADAVRRGRVAAR